MQLDQNPFFRKTITPWYDSNFACWILILALVPVVAFAVVGIVVASGDTGAAPHTWFPASLCALSGFLTLKVFFRIRSRHD